MIVALPLSGRFLMTSQDMANLQNQLRIAVQEHWKAFLIEGILLVVLGLGAMIVPPLASLAVTIFLGWISDQRCCRIDTDLLGTTDARLLVVFVFGIAGHRRWYRSAGVAGPGHADTDHRLGGLLPRRGCCHHHVRT